MTATPQALAGVRLGWDDLPGDLRAVIEQRSGDNVVTHETQWGGFSPGFAAVLTLSSGRRVFVKATSSRLTPEAPRFYRTEAATARLLKHDVPAPLFNWSAEIDDWVLLCFEAVPGRSPYLPWRSDQLGRVMQTLEAMAESGVAADPALPTIGETYGRYFRGWKAIQEGELGIEASPLIDEFCLSGGAIAELAILEADWDRCTSGQALLHGDLRADNMVITEDRAVFVDWAWASAGAAWVDPVLLFPSVAAQGGPAPWELASSSRACAAATRNDLDVAVAAIAGCFLWQGGLAPPPNLPHLRPFQLAIAREALEWLVHRDLVARPLDRPGRAR